MMESKGKSHTVKIAFKWTIIVNTCRLFKTRLMDKYCSERLYWILTLSPADSLCQVNVTSLLGNLTLLLTCAAL